MRNDKPLSALLQHQGGQGGGGEKKCVKLASTLAFSLGDRRCVIRWPKIRVTSCFLLICSTGGCLYPDQTMWVFLLVPKISLSVQWRTISLVSMAMGSKIVHRDYLLHPLSACYKPFLGGVYLEEDIQWLPYRSLPDSSPATTVTPAALTQSNNKSPLKRQLLPNPLDSRSNHQFFFFFFLSCTSLSSACKAQLGQILMEAHLCAPGG